MGPSTKQYLKLIRSLVGYQPDAEEIVSLIQLLSGYTNDSRKKLGQTTINFILGLFYRGLV